MSLTLAAETELEHDSSVPCGDHVAAGLLRPRRIG